LAEAFPAPVAVLRKVAPRLQVRVAAPVLL
jgi:hypothetical protein